VVENITLITPEGKIEQIEPLSRASIGMQPQTLMFGNEGNLGLITRAIIRIHPVPEVTKYGSLVFPTAKQGIDFLYELSRTNFVPASIRLVDNTQFQFGLALKAHVSGMKAYVDKAKKFFVTKIKGFNPYEMVAATLLMEGSAEEVKYQETNLYKLAKCFGGIPGGAEAGQRGYMLTYAIAYIRDFVSTFYTIGETFETTVPWSNIEQVTKAVRQKADEQHKKYGLPGKAYISYRITQTYHSGVCIYFMYSIYYKGVENPADVFGEIEHSLRETIIEHGGSISHHHGVGKLRKDFMKDTLSEDSIEWLKNIKKSVDPQNVFGIRNNSLAD
jgi:alkyldihydroxyacetonephosphate synthase